MGADRRGARRGRPIDGLIVASPSNPTGTVLAADACATCSWCAAHDVQLIADEIYHGIMFDGRRRPRSRSTATRSSSTASRSTSR